MSLRTLATSVLLFGLLLLESCGGGGSSTAGSQQGPLSGNWQMILIQGFPFQNPPAVLSVSGFVRQSDNSVTGSVQLPGSTLNGNCAGIGVLTATMSNQSIAISVDESGATMSMSGSVAPDSKSMSGTYETLAGGCSDKPSSGTWTAFQVPPLSLTFTGTLSQSSYMQLLTGVSPPAPIVVSGSLNQSANIGSSNATLTGRISAVGYPCFRTASLNGTISGENVVLSIIGFQGAQIGTIGTALAPATVGLGASGILLSGNNSDGSGLTLGAIGAGASFGPCPALPNGGTTQPTDTADVAFTFE